MFCICNVGRSFFILCIVSKWSYQNLHFVNFNALGTLFNGMTWMYHVFEIDRLYRNRSQTRRVIFLRNDRVDICKCQFFIFDVLDDKFDSILSNNDANRIFISERPLRSKVGRLYLWYLLLRKTSRPETAFWRLPLRPAVFWMFIYLNK